MALHGPLDMASHSSRFRALLLKLWNSWATRSLAVGAVATGLDLVVGVFCVSALMLPTRPSAMAGVALGAAFTFLANRYFAFKEHNPQLAKPAAKFILATLLAMVVHGQFVVLLRDEWGVPFVISKMIADVVVFTVGQLLLMRFVVFPKQDHPDEEAPAKKGEEAEFKLEPVTARDS